MLPSGLLSRSGHVGARLLRLLSPVPVVGEQLNLPLDAIGIDALERLGHPSMQGTSLSFEQDPVGRVLSEMVLENVLEFGKPHPLADHLLAL